MRIFIAYPSDVPKVDALRDYSERVLDELRATDVDASLLRPPLGRRLPQSLLSSLPTDEECALLIQYNPFSWGRRGFAPMLIVALSAIRRRRPHVRLVSVVHEAYIPIGGWRWTVMSLTQRAQLRAIVHLSDSVAATTEHLCSILHRMQRRRTAHYAPIGSNLPDARAWRAAYRQRLGLEGRLVIATFSNGHIAHMGGHVDAAVEAVAAAVTVPIVFLALGGNNKDRPVGADRVIVPGYLEAEEVARTLAAADLFLSPIADGASTHRGSLMAALQHGLATVATLSAQTDDVLTASAAIRFAPAADIERFAREAVTLAIEPEARAALGEAAARLYEDTFSWRMVCANLLTSVEVEHS